MGKIPQGILGGVSGKVGGIVGTSWKGINVIKTKPLTVANPRTAGQIAQRTKFGNATKFASNILASGIKPLWDRFASRQSGYNAFISENVSLFSDVTPSPESEFILSKGKMSRTPISSIEVSGTGQGVLIEWSDDSGEGYKLGDDVAFICGFKPGNELAEIKTSAQVRSDESISMDLPFTIEVGETVHVYLAFRRADGTVVSDSSYLSATRS